MNAHFAIVQSEKDFGTLNLNIIQSVAGYNVYVSNDADYFSSEDLTIYINGYIIPRNEEFKTLKHLTQQELVKELFLKHGYLFVNYIKGVFTLIIATKDKLSIFTDQFGVNKYFYDANQKIKVISDSIEVLIEYGIKLEPDPIALTIKSILHRNIPGYTSYKKVSQTKPSSHIMLSEKASVISKYWDYESLRENVSVPNPDYNLDYFADLIKSNFKKFNEFLRPKNNFITLTGGKDSRTGLAALMSMGIKPFGFTYGNKLTRDAIYAKLLAENQSISHDVFMPPNTVEWFGEINEEMLSYGNPEISIHRAHRLNAFKEIACRFDNSSAYYAGYMAGEFLMGIYYDNLVFTKFLTDFWDSSIQLPIDALLKKHFHKLDSIHINSIKKELSKLKSFDHQLSKKERQFHGIFEIGIPHHSQDIFLAGKNFAYVYPFFIDIDFLEALFKSRYSFFYTNNKTKNPLSRYKLFEFNLNIQHILYPQMDDVPFGKRGSYNTREYLRGSIYWSIIKTLRYFFQRKKYPATYTYGPAFRSYILAKLTKLNDDKDHILHKYYNISTTIKELEAISGNTSEGEMHKFSNIVSLYSQIQKYNNK